MTSDTNEARGRWGDRGVVKVLRAGVATLLGLATLPFAVVASAAGVLLWAPLPVARPEPRPVPGAPPSRLLAADGTEIGTFRSFDLWLPLAREDVPPSVVDALVAAEDRRFFEHDGVDPSGIVRAAVANYEAGQVVQGGSTITQQYVKNEFLTSDRSFERKFRELLLARDVERELSKDEILYRYLSIVYFGEGAYGLGAAAQSYFGVAAEDLTLSQAALLVGLVRSPSTSSPRLYPQAAEVERQRVLRAMLDTGSISPSAYEEAIVQRVWLASWPDEPAGPVTLVQPPPPNGSSQYGYFADYVRTWVIDRLGQEVVDRGGLTIETTLDLDMQLKAELTAISALDGTASPLEMALVSVEPSTGYVRALVGGRDFTASQVNLALGGSLGMQPGSSFKTFVLAAALESGMGLDQRYDAPAQFRLPDCTGECTVTNYDGEAAGRQTLRAALARSINTVYVQVALDVGVDRVAETAHRLGVASIDPTVPHGPSLALGAYEVSPLDMASAYATFAARGMYHEPTPVRRIVDASGRVLLDNTAPPSRQVLAPEVAEAVTGALRDVVTKGTGRRADISPDVVGKTGTAQEYRAAWFVGYTPALSTAVWMGYSDAQRPLHDIKGVRNVTGGSLPAEIWATFMRSVASPGSTAPADGEPPPVDPGSAPPPVVERIGSLVIAPHMEPRATLGGAA